jgi:hypothetical protein
MILSFIILFSGQRKVLVGVRKDVAILQEAVDVVLTTANFVYQIVKIVINQLLPFLFVFTLLLNLIIW